MSIDRKFLRNFNRDALEALEKVAAAHGVSIKPGSGRFTDSNATVKFEISVITASGEVLTPEAQAFKANAERYGLHPGDLGGTFYSNGEQYRIVGLKPRRPKFPISVERVKDGRAFKMTESTVRNATICQPGTGRRAAHAAQKAEGLTPKIKEGFVGLACQLSPENLSCDAQTTGEHHATVAKPRKSSGTQGERKRSLGLPGKGMT
jgi:hypothetical protein